MAQSDKRPVIKALTLANTPRARIDAAAAEIFDLFLQRETSFGVNPDVTIDYPDLAATRGFLDHPQAYVRDRLEAATAMGQPFGKVVILTTYADRVHDPLVAAGFRAECIDMPAGPDHTFAFGLDLPTGAVRTLYLEAVNEADPKIRPTFALRLLGDGGKLLGGACGSVHERDGRRYAYLGTLTLAPELPAGTGTDLARRMLDLLRQEGVAKIHLGTQTAAPFYEKLGFRITHRLVPALRHRRGKDGQIIEHDLVMMERDLTE